MRNLTKTVIIGFALFTALALAGCGAQEPGPETSVDPKVAPPAVAKAGVLRAGADLTYPPFAGLDGDRKAGIDIDVASALARELGLTLEIVQVTPSEAATALADGTVDIVMAVPLVSDTVMGATLSGVYLADGPAFFVKGATDATATGEATGDATGEGTGAAAATALLEPVPASSLVGKKVGAQLGSVAFWLLGYEIGESEVATFTTLREAFEALDRGDVEVVVADALVGAYIARDFEDIDFGGLIDDVTPLGVAVALENSELDAAVGDALDALAAQGKLDRIRSTWVGDLPRFAVFGDQSAEETATP